MRNEKNERYKQNHDQFIRRYKQNPNHYIGVWYIALWSYTYYYGIIPTTIMG